MCSVQAIHQKAMFLTTQCQDYLQRAKMVLHGVSEVIAPTITDLVCLLSLLMGRTGRKPSRLHIYNIS